MDTFAMCWGHPKGGLTLTGNFTLAFMPMIVLILPRKILMDFDKLRKKKTLDALER